MIRRLLRPVVFSLAMASWLIAVSDRDKPEIRELEHTYVYYLPDTQSPYEGRAEALRKARVDALATAFGTLVSVVNTTDIHNGTVSFRSLGQSEVRGEWLADIAAPQQIMEWDAELQSLRIVTKVKGKARELAGAPTDIVCALLKSDEDGAEETDRFSDGDHIFLRFRSGRSGYLAVFLLDDADRVHTCLPYPESDAGAYAVEKGREYIFFSPRRAEGEWRRSATSYTLRTKRALEQNRLCLIFSPVDFSRSAYENFDPSSRTHSQNYADFDRWLMKLRACDAEVYVTFKDFLIEK